VQAIDPLKAGVCGPIGVGSEPTALAFDATRLWVANAGSNTVQYIVVHKRVNE